jgi:hypothetical protein
VRISWGGAGVKEEEALDEFTEGDALAVRGGFGNFERFGFEGQVKLTLVELGFEFGAGHGGCCCWFSVLWLILV